MKTFRPEPLLSAHSGKPEGLLLHGAWKMP